MPNTSEIKYGQDNSVENAPKLSEEEEHALKSRMAAMDKLLAVQGLAKYKIEIMFEKNRSVTKPMFGLMSFWESGAKLHGGGDTKMYICAGKKLKKSNCEAFIPDAGNGYGFLVCPECRVVWQGEDVDGEVGGRYIIDNWANLIHRYFIKLQGNADIYVKYPKIDIRKMSELEQEKQFKGDKLSIARNTMELCIYPLKNIIKDTNNGADLHTRFVAFLKS